MLPNRRVFTGSGRGRVLSRGEPVLYDQVSRNKWRTALLIAVFIALVVVVGVAVSALFSFGWVGVVVAGCLAVVMSIAFYWKSDRFALVVNRARPADPATFARLHNLVEGLCIGSGLPVPDLYVVDDPAPNAFAVGRDQRHASIGVTSGLLDMMNRIELEGVLAHELSHIRNADILVSTLAVTMVGIGALLADLGIRFAIFGGHRDRGGVAPLVGVISLVFVVLAPLAAGMLRVAASRRRESLADMSAVEMTRYPPGLISALEKLRDEGAVLMRGNRSTAHLWIEDPMRHHPGTSERRARLLRLFDTHPPIEQRIAALREL